MEEREFWVDGPAVAADFVGPGYVSGSRGGVSGLEVDFGVYAADCDNVFVSVKALLEVGLGVF